MGRLFVITLEGLFYSCMYCGTHLALADEILSKSFHSRHGTAYLFNKVVNVTEGEKEDRQMLTGRHTVVDIYCVKCGSVLGWKYVVAHGKSEKYKEGKFIIERVKVVDEGSPNNQPSGSDDDGAYSPITQPNGTGAGNDN